MAGYGRGAGVGRGLGVGTDLGVGVGLAVAVAVGVAVGVAVAVAVGVGVSVAVAVGVTWRTSLLVLDLRWSRRWRTGLRAVSPASIEVTAWSSRPPQTIISLPVQTAV